MRPKLPALDVREIVRVVNFDMFALLHSEGGVFMVALIGFALYAMS
jgi:hypothetical protein